MLVETHPRARHRAVPGGRRRAGRLRELLVAGVADSFGMALGWTVLVLLAVARGGLAEAALYNAAMLGGIVLSAPVASWLSRRLPGRTLLRGAGGIEAVLRVAVLGGLVAGMPAYLVATGVVVMHIAAWAGFAGMRAEVAAVDASPRSMTRYALCIAAVEAAGTGLAALLPVGHDGVPAGWWLVAVFTLYSGSLLPTLFTARRARISPYAAEHRDASAVGYSVARTAMTLSVAPRAGSAGAERGGGRRRYVSIRLLAAGGGVMLLASGPTLLATPLTTELHGRVWVAGAAAAYSLGCLLSTRAVEMVGQTRLPAVLRWSVWGLGMLIGWIGAPLHPASVMFAQFLAGVSQAAFEGDMDARVAEEAPRAGVTTALAYSASIRALGAAIAVRLLPMLVTAQAIDTAASAGVLALGAAALIAWAVTSIRVPRQATA